MFFSMMSNVVVHLAEAVANLIPMGSNPKSTYNSSYESRDYSSLHQIYDDDMLLNNKEPETRT